MKKQLLLSALLLASLSATFVSCKKDTTPTPTPTPTPVTPPPPPPPPPPINKKDLITGTWTVKGAGMDANGNGTLEELEYDPQFKQLVGFGASINQVFSANGNGNLSFVVPGIGGDSTNFTWSLADNDQTLRVKQEGDTTATDATISKLDANNFEYSEKTGSPRNIIVLTR